MQWVKSKPLPVDAILKNEPTFWKKVDIRSGDACWEWKSAKNSTGYGLHGIKIDGKGRCFLAHRVAWVLRNGQIPAGMCVCHRCDNPSCVNPAHLFLGTNLDNVRDMDSKGRRKNWNSARTTCSRGHAYTPENTRIVGNVRICRVCRREWTNRHRALYGRN